MNDERSLMAGINALRMGYASNNHDNFDQIVCPPWTRRDIGDMLDIRKGLDWLIAEIKSGYTLTEERHGWTIRNIDALHAALNRKELDCLAKAGFNPNQPRVPAGSPDGGEWTDGGGGSVGSRPTQKPRGNIIGELFGIRPAYGDTLPKPNSKPRSPREVARHLRSANPEPMEPKLPKEMSASPEAVEKIIGSEDFKPHPYRVRDNNGKPSGNWTIGYGHEIRRGETFPEDGLTPEGAEKLLDQDIREAENAVRRRVKVPLTQLQFDSLTSLTYNIGSGNLRDSEILKRLNEGDYDGAADAFSDYAYSRDSTGKPEIKPGLSTRRAEEADLFRQGTVQKKRWL